jgi:peptidoglycan/LPS O-acetylase OafA/YrhL
MKFRNDINGLRGLAVAAVVLYHFGIGGLQGGFAGVDIFFVISGYLMTEIILGRMQEKRFSVLEFYAGRAKRILPALATVCLALMAGGYFWLIPSDLQMLGEHAAAAISFISNLTFSGERGYFDAPMRETWLLHSWSLSVEWQFYIIYPLLLMGWVKYAKLSKRKFLWLFCFLAAISLLISMLTTPIKPNDAFYLLPARVWEFMAGACLCLLPTPRKYAAGIEVLGMAAILASFFLFRDATPWPGYGALLPVLGAALVIFSARQQSWWTGNAVFQALGKISYSVYLWHWPVYVGLVYFSVIDGSGMRSAGVIASLLLGTLSYIFIETPTRKNTQKWSLARSAAVFVGMIAFVASLGLVLHFGKGFPARVSQEIYATDLASKNKYKLENNCNFNRHTTVATACSIGKGEGTRFIIWGDSHSGAISSAVAEAAHGRGLLYLAFCPTIFNAEIGSIEKPHCARFNDMIFADIRKLPKDIPLIIVNRFSNYLARHDGETAQERYDLVYSDADRAGNDQEKEALFKTRLTRTLCEIAAARPVYVLKPIPEMGSDVPKTMARAGMTGHMATGISITTEQYAQRHRAALEALDAAGKTCGVKLLDPVPALCEHGQCRGSADGKPLYFDNNHLSESGNKKLVPVFAPVFNR